MAIRSGIAMVCALCVTVLSACGLPPLEDRPQSTALTTEEVATTRLGHVTETELTDHPGLTGIDPLADPLESFAARVDLVRTAERTLDVQYYIWRNDLTGTLLLEELQEAASRGVRVRLLLDDHGIPSAMDDILAALAAHPNVEVRLFNPFVWRKPKFIGFVTDFSRLNRRMHNKSLTADGIATIIGGRNIGDEYFGANDGVVFADLDVLAIGPAAREVENDFDRYWASASAYPAGQILPRARADELGELDASARAVHSNPAATAYVESLQQTTDVRRLVDGTLPLDWAKARLVSDDPAKALGTVPPEELVLPQLLAKLGRPTHEFDLISPYFVPGEDGTRYLTQLAGSGVTVRVLTNSLEATDVAPVHAGYAKRRVALLQGDVQLYELRGTAGATAQKYFSTGSYGSSGSSLHAKTFAVDSERVFVGSLNLDPRSANLNTELGLVIDSPELALRIESVFWTLVPKLAYEVKLDDHDKLYWTRQYGGETIRYDTEPNTTWFGRLSVSFFSILPIEWLL
ncbi:phospholipase D family protein [Paraburkholderia humisilvae]|nr:phospholipase D family protein [Paraburkholderia humisilvae]